MLLFRIESVYKVGNHKHVDYDDSLEKLVNRIQNGGFSLRGETFLSVNLIALSDAQEELAFVDQARLQSLIRENAEGFKYTEIPWSKNPEENKKWRFGYAIAKKEYMARLNQLIEGCFAKAD